MLNLLRQLSRPKYETLNRIEIVADNILYNYKQLQARRPAAKIWPVLKSNAYGHGLKEICQILNQSGAEMVVVDSFPEAQIVYKNFRGRVLILGEMPLSAYKYCQFRRTEFCLYNPRTLRYLAEEHPGARIHLFLNSGMNREGIKDIKAFYQENKAYLNQVKISGLASHLAAEGDKTKEQEKCFLSMISYLQEQGIKPEHIHLGNSAGFYSEINGLAADTFRVGLALYGYGWPGLKPALKVYSKIVSLQEVEAGESISYGTDYIVAAKTRTAVIPFGYFEGLDRRLSVADLKFTIKGQPAKIAGRVSMNLTVLDIHNNPQIALDDEVELVSLDREASNSVENLARAMGTIPYEFLVKLQGNIRRVIV